MSADEPIIWPPYEAFYIQSMLFNSMSAMRSIARLEATFKDLPEHATDDDVQRLPAKRILDELQNMVLQAAALSRYFWPVRRAHEARGKLLRETFALEDSSPLYDRKLRNALEHFDERLDRYVASGIVGCIFPEYVGRKPADDGVPGHFFRAYFVDAGAFRLLDEDFEMQPLADELIFVHSHLTDLDRNGGRLRPSTREAGAGAQPSVGV